MWMPKWYWENLTRQQSELERRVKRLELTLLRDAENKITSLRDEKAGSVERNGISTIEKIVDQFIDA